MTDPIDASPEDIAEQQRPLVEDLDDDEQAESDAGEPPIEADETDLLEQHTAVPVEADDEW